MDYKAVAVVEKITKRRCGRIKWWRLQGPCKEEFQKAIASKWESEDFDGNSNKIWEKIAETLTEAAVVVLGKTKGGKRIQKETAWWNDAVKQQVKDKKTKFKKWQRTRDAADQHEYQEAKKTTKRMMAEVKAKAYKDLYQKLDSREGEKMVYRLAKARERATRDVCGTGENC